jgi:hypothetical protein
MPAGSACDAAIECRLSNSGRHRGGDLFQCGPALTDENDLKAKLKFIPGTLFQGVQPIQ